MAVVDASAALVAASTLTVAGTRAVNAAASVVAASALIVTAGVPLAGWVADTSQRTILALVTSSVELDYTPPAVLGSGPELLPPPGYLALCP